MDDTSLKSTKLHVLSSSQDYFTEVIENAVDKRKIQVSPLTAQYLVGLLNTYVVADNLNIKSTLAEALLSASLADGLARREQLKRLGDTSLYVSGFFGDSLRRKIIDIDYYAEIGGAAYGTLASEIDIDIHAQVYKDFSVRFLEYVDLLTYISQSSLVQSNTDLLRLYERYVKTGSEMAREQLAEKGLIATEQMKKSSNQ